MKSTPSSIFDLLASEDQTLPLGRDAHLILDFRLYHFYGIAGSDVIDCDRRASRGLHEDLLASIGGVTGREINSSDRLASKSLHKDLLASS